MNTRFKAGTRLIHEGDHSRKMFIIQKGKARVFKTYLGQRITLAILGEGELFGELSFFDAEPRSASVEALTDLEAIVVESREGGEIAGLPPWVSPILRSAFRRFREADRKVTILQCMAEYQKRAFKKDVTGQTIYLELLRFIKTIEVVHEAEPEQRMIFEEFHQKIDELLGQRVISLRVFWQTLREHGILEDKSDLLEIRLKAFNSYLTEETRTERYLLLSHTAVAILRRIVGFTDAKENSSASNSTKSISVSIDDLGLDRLPFYKESLNELVNHKILTQKDERALLIDPASIARHYVCQDILKAFDHTTMSIE